jgi:ribosomal-protein-alanine N-acetyltransferase
MKIFIETERLIIREMLLTDEQGMWDMDSDPEVHTYLGNQPVTSMVQVQEVIAMVRQQYIDNGIGRWVMEDKHTHDFIGWTGYKLVKEQTEGYDQYYDIGYRLARKHWGKGYASESAIACLNYGFEVMKLDEVNGRASMENLASRRVLEKTGLKFIDTRYFMGIDCAWYSLKKAEWENK